MPLFLPLEIQNEAVTAHTSAFANYTRICVAKFAIAARTVSILAT